MIKMHPCRGQKTDEQFPNCCQYHEMFAPTDNMFFRSVWKEIGEGETFKDFMGSIRKVQSSLYNGPHSCVGAKAKGT